MQEKGGGSEIVASEICLCRDSTSDWKALELGRFIKRKNRYTVILTVLQNIE